MGAAIAGAAAFFAGYVCGLVVSAIRERRYLRGLAATRRGGYLPPRAYRGSAYPTMPHHGSVAGIGSLEGRDRGNGLLPAGSDD